MQHYLERERKAVTTSAPETSQRPFHSSKSRSRCKVKFYREEYTLPDIESDETAAS